MCEDCKARIEKLENDVKTLSDAIAELDYRTRENSDGDYEMDRYIKTPIPTSYKDYNREGK